MIFYLWTLIRFFSFSLIFIGIALINGEVQTKKGLRWIPRHPETKKGVASDEMLRGAENKYRSGDSRMG